MFKQDFDELAFFRGMSPQQVRELEPLFDLCTFAAGEVIFEQGQPAEYLYVLSAGEVLVQYKPYDCLLYTSDAADDLLCVDLGGRRIIKKKKKTDKLIKYDVYTNMKLTRKQ